MCIFKISTYFVVDSNEGVKLTTIYRGAKHLDGGVEHLSTPPPDFAKIVFKGGWLHLN